MQMTEKKVCAHRPWRVAMRRQSLSCCEQVLHVVAGMIECFVAFERPLAASGGVMRRLTPHLALCAAPDLPPSSRLLASEPAAFATEG